MPATLPALGLACDGARLAQHMRHDKKMDTGTLPFVLLRGLGQAFVARDVDLGDLAKAVVAETLLLQNLA